MIRPTPRETAESQIDAIEDLRGKSVVRVAGIVVKSCGGNSDEAETLVKWIRLGVIRILEEQEREFSRRLESELKKQLEQIRSEA